MLKSLRLEEKVVLKSLRLDGIGALKSLRGERCSLKCWAGGECYGEKS